MNFREAARRIALTTQDDMDLESTMSVDDPPHPWEGTPPPSTDNMDPASPGGPAPFNGAEPFSEPVVDDQEWLDPRETANGTENTRGRAVPYTPGSTSNITTLHNARRAAYERRPRRFRP